MKLGALAEAAGRALSGGHENGAAHAVMRESLRRLSDADEPVPMGLIMSAVDAAVLLGEADYADRLLSTSAPAPDAEIATEAEASLLLRAGRRHWSRGEGDEAMAAFHSAARAFTELNVTRDAAICRGQIADILVARGETEKALRIRHEEQLPVFERLGDVRERAVTMGKIADILAARGETDEAVRIRHEEQLPVFERLGDVRSRAVCMGKIADILETRGETEEALRIRREEELPVYERLGDVRSRAVTMGKIADILVTRGETEEALRIHRVEELPVYERLGDVRSRAVTMGEIADILQARGETEEALRIRREEQLPVFERFGDVREKSATLFKIATARLDSEGIELGEIQSIYEELAEAYAIALRLGIPDGISAIGTTLAQVQAIGGQQDEALKTLDAARVAFEKLGNQEGLAHVQALTAAIEDSRA